MFNKPVMLAILSIFMMMLLSLITRQQHLLPMLLCLESLMLLMTLYILSYKMYQCMNIMMNMIILLTMSVSSASIGLSLLISLSRKEGNDSTMFKTFQKS